MTSPAPQRLAKWIAQSGYCSRRAAERLITQGVISINGAVARHTDGVSALDQVFVHGQPLPAPPALQYLLYHKPVGVDCNNRPDDPASLYQILRLLPQRLFAVGRLDKDSSGLLLLTNDGDLSQRLMHPAYYHEKGYLVSTDKSISAGFIASMAAGVSWQLGETRYQSRPCRITQTAEQEFYIVLTQGLHRQIRYMCKALGYRVIALKRDRLHNLQLAQLPEGQMRPLSSGELHQLQLLSALPQP